LTVDGLVYTWGSSEHGQIGRKASPRYPIHTLQPEIVGQLRRTRIVKIGAGSYHTLAADSWGRIYAWGLNNARQCLVDEADQIPHPVELPFFEGTPVKQLVAGMHHSVVLLENGEVYAFGDKENGKLGLGGDQQARGYLTAEELRPLTF